MTGHWSAAPGRVTRALAQLEAAPVRVGAALFVVALVVPCLLSGGEPPVPEIQDEFSHLLMADTFAAGRLTNPTPPHWEHFETLHVIHQPTYQSKYPPGLGLALALGQVTLGEPIYGVWLSLAAAAVATFWMLGGFVPWPWAAYGGLLLALHPGIAGGFGNTYWTGGLGILGGALLFGALPRILRGPPQAVHGICLGAGLVVLAVSRPFEGLISSLVVAALLLMWLIRRPRPAPARVMTALVLPVVVLVGLGGAALGTYHQAVTGDAAQMPYGVHEAQYGASGAFIWEPVRAERIGVHRHKPINDYHRWRYWENLRHRRPGYLARSSADKLAHLFGFYPGWLLTPFLLPLPWLLGMPGVRLAVGTIALVVTTLLATKIMVIVHYIAPVASLFFLLFVQGARYLWSSRGLFGFPVGVGYAALVPVGLVVLGFQTVAERTQAANEGWHGRRAQIAQQLSAQGGRHLVVVRYGPEHVPGHEWVYNRADIGSATVVWARDIDAAHNRALLEHFAGHKAWLLEVTDQEPPALSPYPRPAASDAGSPSAQAP